MKIQSALSVTALLAIAFTGTAAQITVKAVNHLQLARPAYTLELSAKDLGPLGDLQKIHVKDSSGKEVLAQAVDTDLDELHKPDILIFQADFGLGETKTFTLTTGGKHAYKKEQFKAHGRFVR